MVRLILASFVMVAILLNSGCSKDSGRAPSGSSQMVGDVRLYTFSPDDQYFLRDAEPFVLPPSTSIRDALDRLGRHLATNYFSKTYTDKPTDIHFEVVRIDEISTQSRPFRIAVINMVDTEQEAMGYFFQGSTGARTTFCMLAATFTQPHLAPPLLDGLVLLYNGEMLSELDHINLAGILTPRLVQGVAYRAIRGMKR
jgi:hypothetical protein